MLLGGVLGLFLATGLLLLANAVSLLGSPGPGVGLGLIVICWLFVFVWPTQWLCQLMGFESLRFNEPSSGLVLFLLATIVNAIVRKRLAEGVLHHAVRP